MSVMCCGLMTGPKKTISVNVHELPRKGFISITVWKLSIFFQKKKTTHELRLLRSKLILTQKKTEKSVIIFGGMV